MSDTPRTDAAPHFWTVGGQSVVLTTYAESLERELATERAARQAAEARLAEAMTFIESAGHHDYCDYLESGSPDRCSCGFNAVMKGHK